MSYREIIEDIQRKRFEYERHLVSIAKDIEALRAEAKATHEKLRQCEAAARLFGHEMTTLPNDPTVSRALVFETVEDVVMKHLRECPDGFRLRQRRPLIEHDLGRPVHEKTIGVALNRMRRKGIVERNGETWILADYIAHGTANK